MCMHTNKLYANATKCIFGAGEISFLGCFIVKLGLRADPAKVKAIADWYVPRSQKNLRTQISTLLAVGCPTASRGFTLGGDEGDEHRSSAAYGILSANVVTDLR